MNVSKTKAKNEKICFSILNIQYDMIAKYTCFIFPHLYGPTASIFLTSNVPCQSKICTLQPRAFSLYTSIYSMTEQLWSSFFSGHWYSFDGRANNWRHHHQKFADACWICLMSLAGCRCCFLDHMICDLDSSSGLNSLTYFQMPLARALTRCIYHLLLGTGNI